MHIKVTNDNGSQAVYDLSKVLRVWRGKTGMVTVTFTGGVEYTYPSRDPAGDTLWIAYLKQAGLYEYPSGQCGCGRAIEVTNGQHCPDCGTELFPF